MNTILIVEDDKEISQLLTEYLNENGYETIALYQGLKIMDYLKKGEVAMILLDIMLPYKNGDQILAEIRSVSKVPVIVISAKGTTQNKIDLLRMGADDYITKPFDLEETLARIESNLRRVRFQEKPLSLLKFQGLELDAERHLVYCQGQEINLTSKEYSILELLMCNPNKVFSKANLFESIWREEYLSEDNPLNVHISNLRNKLKAANPQQEYIDTVWGIGYRLHKD